jgi:predicted PurR-regulated permease PerM
VLKVEVSYRGLVVVGLALLSLWALVRLWPVILLVVTAFIFMAALLPFVEWLVRRGVRRVAAVLLILLVVLLILAGLVALLVPALIDEFQSIRDNLPDDAAKLEDFLANFGIDVQLQQRARDIDWAEFISGRAAFSFGQQAIQVALSVFTVIVMTVYLLIDTPRLKSFLFQFVPEGREADANLVLEQLSRVVGGYLRGQVITSLIIALYTLTVLLILGVPNAFAFAALAGFADIIPLIGAFISILPASFAAFHESPTKAAIVLGMLLLYQQFEDRVLVPRVYSATLNLPPIMVLLAVLAGGELLGIPGILLALPAAAVGRVALDYYLEHRKKPVAAAPATEEPFAPDA